MRSWQSRTQSTHPLAAPLLLLAVVLAVYYPALLSGVHSVDDPGIIELYSASPPLPQILLPGPGYYYRPLLELTYWLDNLLWGMQPRAMHLENILLHYANSLAVYLLARRVQGVAAGLFAVGPLLAALLFALHPVNVEAVAWIAGRTDPLLSLLVLSSFFFWLKWLAEPRRRDLSAALALFGAALLAKETALAAGGVLLLTALLWPGGATSRQRLGALALLATPALLLVCYAVSFRSGTSALSMFLTQGDTRPWQGLKESVTAFGFYAGKVVFPLPLNAAITGVSGWFALPGLALFPLLYWLRLRSKEAAILFTCAVIMTAPAVVVAVKQVAWTLYAERYLYLPLAFCALGLVAALRAAPQQLLRHLALAAAGILAFSAFFTLQRTLLWKDKLAFTLDAIEKEPGFGSLYNDLGIIYLQRDEVEKAADAFATADRLNQRESMRLLIRSNLMAVDVVRGDHQKARELFFRLFKAKKDAPVRFLELLHQADTRKLQLLSGAQKVELARDLLETLDLLNQKRYDPFWLYRSGQLSLVTGDRKAAREFFSRAYRLAPADAHYREGARVYLTKLGRTP